MRTRETVIRVARGIAILTMLLGVFFVADGLLPTKSVGPNPMWPEVLLGLIILVVGIATFTIGRSLLARRNTAAGTTPESEDK